VSPRYLLDTNVLSEPLRPHPHKRVVEHLRRSEGLLATASIVWHELLYGAARLPDSPKRRAIQQYLSEVVAPTIPILAYDERAAEWHAAERSRLERAGRAPAFADGQIAAVARVHGLVVVTRNTADYAGFEGVAVENWHR